MPRVSADSDEMIQEQPRRAPRSRAKKAAPAQDRLSSRALFIRRLRRSLRPGLWLIGALAVVIVIAKLVSSMPAAPATEAASARHGTGFASIGAALGLRISNVQISGAKETDMALLRQAIGVSQGEPTFGFSLTEVRQRVEQLGPVQTATVERELPGTLVVSITERNAFAIWQTGGTNGQPPAFELIDKQGNVISQPECDRGEAARALAAAAGRRRCAAKRAGADDRIGQRAQRAFACGGSGAGGWPALEPGAEGPDRGETSRCGRGGCDRATRGAAGEHPTARPAGGNDRSAHTWTTRCETVSCAASPTRESPGTHEESAWP